MQCAWERGVERAQRKENPASGEGGAGDGLSGTVRSHTKRHYRQDKVNQVKEA